MIEFKHSEPLLNQATPERLSTNAKLDFITMLFTKALIQISNNDYEDEGTVSRSNNAYNVNKRIDRRLDKIEQKLEQSVKDMYAVGQYDLAQWVKANMDKRIATVLADLSEKNINLELLAMQILYINFIDFRGTKKLHKHMQWIEGEKTAIFDMLDLFDKTSIGHLEGSMYDLAQRAIARIKR